MALPLDMMAAPASTPGPMGNQDSQSQKDVAMVLRKLDEGKKAREPFDKDWDEYRSFYKGEQYKIRKAGVKSTPVLNILRPTIQTIIPIMTDNQPGFNVTGKRPQDFQIADDLEKVQEDLWERRGWNHTLIESLMDSCIYGTGVLKVTWNNDLEESLGDVDIQRVDPKEIYVPKNAVDFEKNCPWSIHKPMRRLSEIKRKFPEFADQLTADSVSDVATNKSETMSGKIELVSPVDRKSPIQPFSTTPLDEAQEVEIAEYWAESEELEEDEKEGDDSQSPDSQSSEKRLKYPQGVLITIAVKQKIRLQKIANPYKDGKKPFVRIVNTIMPGQFWGEGEVEPLMPIQKILNKNIANIMDYMNMCGNPCWLIPKDSGINPDKVTNQMGLILLYNGDKAPARDIPPPLPSAFFDFYNTISRFADVVSGVHDVTQGRQPTGITAAQAIQTLQEAAQTRIRLKERNLNTSLSFAGTLIISRIMQFYREPRIAKVTDGSQWPQYFEYYIEDVQTPDGHGQYALNKKNIRYNPQTKQYAPDHTFTKSEPTEGLFNIRIEAGSSLPFVKAQKTDLAFKLFSAGAIDKHELLETVDWPNLEQLEQRMAKADQGKPVGEPPRVSYSANAQDPNAAEILAAAGIQPPQQPQQPQPQGQMQ